MILKAIKTTIKNINSSGITYLLSEEESTARIIDYKSNNDEILIQFSIIHEEKEYIITSISEGAFKCCGHIKSIQFTTNSNLQKIEKNAFFNSRIEFISIPSNLVELQEGWCAGTPKLTKFQIISNNQKYSNYENQFIIGKSSLEIENFDLLVFSVRDIKTAKIPSFIEKIEPYAFNECRKIKNVEFCKNSKIQTIEKLAFYFSSIEKISIPEKLTKIGQLSFYCCQKLRNIEIPKNSRLQIIEKSAFYDSGIECFTIPASLMIIDEYAFYSCKKLQIIEIDEDSRLKFINHRIFDDNANVLIMSRVNLIK